MNNRQSAGILLYRQNPTPAGPASDHAPAQADPTPEVFLVHPGGPFWKNKHTGTWTIRFLLITLCVTPLRKIFNQPRLVRYRRMLGLFAFFYVCLHFMTWFILDKSFSLSDMWADVVKRRFITVGMLGFALLLPLAITSTAGWVRRLGFVKWQRLHRLIYFAALAGVIHYCWLVKSDERLPLMYGAILGVLMAYRFYIWRQTAGPRTATTPRTASLPG